VSEDIYKVYERSERIVSIMTKMDIVLRILMSIGYIAMISEITGIPMVELVEYIAKYMRVMPSILEPYRAQILLGMLVVDTIDVVFGSILIRMGKENYIKSISLLLFILGTLTFCGYPSIGIFICFVLPKFLALYVAIAYPQSVKAMVKFYEEGVFE